MELFSFPSISKGFMGQVWHTRRLHGMHVIVDVTSDDAVTSQELINPPLPRPAPHARLKIFQGLRQKGVCQPAGVIEDLALRESASSPAEEVRKGEAGVAQLGGTIAARRGRRARHDGLWAKHR